MGMLSVGQLAEIEVHEAAEVKEGSSDPTLTPKRRAIGWGTHNPNASVCPGHPSSQVEFFKKLGGRVKELQLKKGYSQEDKISFDFSARHWQQIEAGRQIIVTTLLRICDFLQVKLQSLVKGIPH